MSVREAKDAREGKNVQGGQDDDDDSGSGTGSYESEEDEDEGQREGDGILSLLLAVLQAGLLLASALEAPHAYRELSQARPTPISPPANVFAALWLFAFLGQIAFNKLCFEYPCPPVGLQCYVSAGLLVQFLLLRAIARRMWATSVLLGLFDLVACFEQVYKGAGVTRGCVYTSEVSSPEACRIRVGEFDPCERVAGRRLFFPAVSVTKGLLVAIINICILHCLPKDHPTGVACWTGFVVLVCAVSAVMVANGQRGDLALPWTIVCTVLGGGLAVQDLTLKLSFMSPWYIQAVAIVQVSCTLLVAWAVMVRWKGSALPTWDDAPPPGDSSGDALKKEAGKGGKAKTN